MEVKRIETSKKRLEEKINTVKEYLEKKDYDFNELTRLKNQLEKKKEQFERDVKIYETVEQKDEDKVEEYKSELLLCSIQCTCITLRRTIGFM